MKRTHIEIDTECEKQINIVSISQFLHTAIGRILIFSSLRIFCASKSYHSTSVNVKLSSLTIN